MVDSQTSPQLAAAQDDKAAMQYGKPEFKWNPPKIAWKLVLVGVLILLCAGAIILYGALKLSDGTLAYLGLHSRVDFIASAAKFAAMFGAGFWAAALVILLHQRELAQASLRKSDAEIRDFDAKFRKTEADIQESGLRAKNLEAKTLADLRETETKIRQLELAMKRQPIAELLGQYLSDLPDQTAMHDRQGASHQALGA